MPTSPNKPNPSKAINNYNVKNPFEKTTLTSLAPTASKLLQTLSILF
jgi:hypothetical protein